MPHDNEDTDNSSRFLDAMMIQDPYLSVSYAPTTPAGSPPGPKQLRYPNVIQRQQVAMGHINAIPQSLGIFHQTAPFVPPRSFISASKRSAPQTEAGDDDAMQGKDVPTIFKRRRQVSAEDRQASGSSNTVHFVPFHANTFAANTQGGQPGIIRAIEAPTGRAPAGERASSAPGYPDDANGPSRKNSATDRRSFVEEENDDDDGLFSGAENPEDAEDADAEDEAHTTRTKGKARARGNPPQRSPPRSSQTFATQLQVSHMQNDLHEMNHNISRLVDIMDQQTKFFSTLQARGFFERSDASSTTTPPAAPPAPPNGPDYMNVDAPDFVPIPRRSRRGRTQEPKLKGLPTQRDPDDVTLADQVRALTRKLMNRKNAKDPLTDEMLPTDEAVLEYDPHQGPCCTVQTFRPDLNSPSHSTWNACVIEVFVDHFMELHPDAPQQRVDELFSGHLKYLCHRWQMSALDPQKLRERQRLLNRSERQRNLYYRRLAVAHAYAPLRRHIPMLMSLGVKGMSSDESDNRNGVAQYGVLRKEWRNPRITPWLRVFDSLYRRLRMNDVDQNSPGSAPHNRFYSDRTSNRRPPVKYLPRNAYDPAWLASLHQYDQKQLGVKEVDYDFSHDKTMLDFARDYNGKHNPLGLYF